MNSVATLEEKIAALRAQPTLEDKIAALRQKEEVSGVAAFGDAAGRTLANNALNVFEGAGNLLAGGAALVQRPFSDQSLGELFQEEQGKFPASALRAIPTPNINQIGAATRSIPSLFPGGETPSEAFGRNLSDIEAEEARLRENAPFATGAGEVAGDVATLAMGRLPFARGINRFEKGLMNRTPVSFDPKTVTISQEALQVLDRAWKSKGVSKLLKGAGRSAEVGAEAAVLEALKGDDPFETAGLAAGIQLGSSVALSAAEAPSTIFGAKSKRAKFLVNVATLAGGLAVLDNLTDIGPDSIVGSIDSAFDKVTLLMVGGLALSPFGRIRSEAAPKLGDLATSIPRSAVISMLERVKDKGDETRQKVGQVLSGAVEGAYTPEQVNGIVESIEKDEFVENVDSFLFQTPPRLSNGNPR